MSTQTFKVFGIVTFRDGKQEMLQNVELPLGKEAHLRTLILSAFPQVRKFSAAILDMTREQFQETAPKWFQKAGGVLFFREGEKPKAEPRKRFKIKKGFLWNGKQLKRGMFVSLLPNDPRIEFLKEQGNI